MIFEFSIARKYLVPRKRQLSMSLIALMSVVVISLVVWLVLVFLSVTYGIEKSWLTKLTSFNSPVRITPTEAYYNSYYYQVDAISHSSEFQLKSIGEKLVATLTDPHGDEDMEIPSLWPQKICNGDGSVKDLIKEAFHAVRQLSLTAQDYEVAGAVLKLVMTPSHSQESGRRYLTQASYVSSFCEKSPKLSLLIDPPRVEDLNQLFHLAHAPPGGWRKNGAGRVKKGASVDPIYLQSLLSHVSIKKMQNSSSQWQSLALIMPDGVEFDATAFMQNGEISHFLLPLKRGKNMGKLVKHGGCFHFCEETGGQHYNLDLDTPLFIDGLFSMEVKLSPTDPGLVESLQDLWFHVHSNLQGCPLEGRVPWEGLEITHADANFRFEKEPTLPPPWPYVVKSEVRLPPSSEHAILLPTSFQNQAVKIGDSGYFSYGAATTSSMQEQRIPVYVAGFYDPGVMAIGARCILASTHVVRAINTSSSCLGLDPNIINGIQVYLEDLSQAKEVKRRLVEAFDRAGLLPYFEITTFYEYDFAKDLLLQFQSDKYLFTLVGIIVLLVACSNIISLLVILVKDKRREIAILRAMGASKRSIALIFTLCGGAMGVVSTLIGTLAAIFTLHNIDVVVRFLSFLQGHEAFNAIFYGKSLPNELSHHALIFIIIATPLISLLAGCVPAIKACSLPFSQILRSE